MAKVLPFPSRRDRNYELREAHARREIEDNMGLWGIAAVVIFALRGPEAAKAFLDRKVAAVCERHEVDGPIF